jgi:hypothetical protein
MTRGETADANPSMGVSAPTSETGVNVLWKPCLLGAESGVDRPDDRADRPHGRADHPHGRADRPDGRADRPVAAGSKVDSCHDRLVSAQSGAARALRLPALQTSHRSTTPSSLAQSGTAASSLCSKMLPPVARRRPAPAVPTRGRDRGPTQSAGSRLAIVGAWLCPRSLAVFARRPGRRARLQLRRGLWTHTS